MNNPNRMSIGLVALAVLMALVAMLELRRRADEAHRRLDAAQRSWSGEPKTANPEFSFEKYAEFVVERRERTEKQPLPEPVVPTPGAEPRTKMSNDLIAALDDAANEGRHRVIVQVVPTESESRADAVTHIRSLASRTGSSVVREIPLIHAVVLDLDSEGVQQLAAMPYVARVTKDAVVRGTASISSQAIGADLVHATGGVDGFDGQGVTVAMIDSGVYRYHEDFYVSYDAHWAEYFDTMAEVDQVEIGVWTTWNGTHRRAGRAISIDFTDRSYSGYDKYGHGTHVASIISGASNTSWYEESHKNFEGIAPSATLLSMRVLDENGEGYTSHVLEAIAYVVENQDSLNVRVMNVSLGHPVYESYETDPLALACAAASQAGIAVVCSAGNNGTNALDTTFGTINSPGNAPWVITVGSSDTKGTVARGDDGISSFSSVGPTAIDGHIKPDLVAPGSGIISSMNLNATLAEDYSHLLRGPSWLHCGYMEMSGTSMSAAVVSGTLALMFEANPSLTPNAAKTILMYTAEKMTNPTLLQQGCGLLNAEGAVRLASAIRQDSDEVPVGEMWLNADSEEEALGMLDPVTEIGGEPAYWGSVLTWGNGFIWGGGVGDSDGDGDNGDESVLWGDGFEWDSVLTWADGFQWFDSIVGESQEVMANCFLWQTGCTGGGGGGGSGGTNGWGGDTQGTQNVIWDFPEILATWSGALVDPMSIMPLLIHERVLATGESGEGTDEYVIGTPGDWFFPVRPN